MTFDLQVADLEQTAERSKKESKRLRDFHQEEIVLFEEQLNALKTALKVSEKECDRIRTVLEKEVTDSFACFVYFV
jgi:molecular chaperone GrpE (heat shock protein)